MKRTFFLAVILGIAFIGILSAQEADYSEVESLPEVPSAVADADNPGMGLLDQATEAKLRASTVTDLRQVILLCQRAKKEGLSGESLKYCNQLLASSQLQRGLFLSQLLLKPDSMRNQDWRTNRQITLNDLEEAVVIIKDQPIAYLRIAQLNLLPDGNEDRAKEALKLAVQCPKSEPEIQMQVVRLLADLEPEAEKREVLLAAAAENGNSEIKLLYAFTLFELNRKNEALNVLQKLIDDESNNPELHERIITILADLGENESAMSFLNTLREKGMDERKDRIDLMRAELLNKMGQYNESLTLLDSLDKKFQGNTELTVPLLILRSTTYLAMDNPEEALKNIEAALQVHPGSPRILEQKYSILVEQKKFSDALDVAKKLQSIADRPQDFLREVHILSEQEKYDDALEILQKLRKKYPDGEPLWIMGLVEILSKQKAYDKALALVEEQLKDEPEELRWIVAKTQVFTEQKKWDEAMNWLESCLQKNPDSQGINLELINVLTQKKSYKAAKERLNTLLEKKPDDPRLLFMDSQLLISLGLHSDAVKALTKVIETEPNDYTSLNNLAWVLATSPIDSVRNGHRALELAEKACTLSHYKRAFVLSTLAAAHAELGDFDKAREWSQKSIDLAKMEKSKTEEERKELLENLQKELDSFKQNMPYRELMDEGK